MTTPSDAGTGADAGPADGGGPPSGLIGEVVPLERLPCASGTDGCAVDAPDEARVDGTCCARGDNLLEAPTGLAAEAVDLEANEELAVLCGGFGAFVNRLRGGDSPPLFLGQVIPRCQNAELGPETDEGRVLLLSHHGDTWVSLPGLWTVLVTPEGDLLQRDEVRDPDILFEGVRHHGGYVYAAAHEGGLYVYRLTDELRLAPVTALGGLGNAWNVEIDADRDIAYVVDAEGAIHVLSLADPEAPELLWTVETSASPRDLTQAGDRLFVALGGFGVDVFDAPDPGSAAPSRVARIPTIGSAQAVSSNGDVLAVAAWTHVAVYDVESLGLLATEKTRPREQFEQDLGVAIVGNRLHVAEWESLHSFDWREGYVAPGLWIDESIVSFEPTVEDARAIIVRNLGPLELQVTGIGTSLPAFSVDTMRFDVAPNEAGFFEVLFTPPATIPLSFVEIASNDVDEGMTQLFLAANGSARFGEGDRLENGAFGFLDPTGGGEVAELEGDVLVLAYFALF